MAGQTELSEPHHYLITGDYKGEKIEQFETDDDTADDDEGDEDDEDDNDL